MDLASVIARALRAYQEIATCESWLAEFGPEAERTRHALAASWARTRMSELAEEDKSDDHA